MSDTQRLDTLGVGSQGVIRRVSGEGSLKKRLLTMGVVPGTTVVVAKRAPLGDPIDITVKGFHLTLRNEEASLVDVEVL